MLLLLLLLLHKILKLLPWLDLFHSVKLGWTLNSIRRSIAKWVVQTCSFQSIYCSSYYLLLCTQISTKGSESLIPTNSKAPKFRQFFLARLPYFRQQKRTMIVIKELTKPRRKKNTINCNPINVSKKITYKGLFQKNVLAFIALKRRLRLQFELSYKNIEL